MGKMNWKDTYMEALIFCEKCEAEFHSMTYEQRKQIIEEYYRSRVNDDGIRLDEYDTIPEGLKLMMYEIFHNTMIEVFNSYAALYRRLYTYFPVLSPFCDYRKQNVFEIRDMSLLLDRVADGQKLTLTQEDALSTFLGNIRTMRVRFKISFICGVITLAGLAFIIITLLVT